MKKISILALFLVLSLNVFAVTIPFSEAEDANKIVGYLKNITVLNNGDILVRLDLNREIYAISYSNPPIILESVSKEAAYFQIIVTEHTSNLLSTLFFCTSQDIKVTFILSSEVKGGRNNIQGIEFGS